MTALPTAEQTVPVAAAYAGVIIIWATTPLAIKWSGEGPGWLFGVMSRMLLGSACVWLLMLLTRTRLPLDRAALVHYTAGALGIYGAMLLSYWGAQHMPSGWLSVLFGLSPLVTALLSPRRLSGQALALGGLFVIYGDTASAGPAAAAGIGAVLLAVILHSVSGVWIKRLDVHMPALASVGGSMALALPAYGLTWCVLDGAWPGALPAQALLSITYLGVVATTAGFTLYYHVLRHLRATQVALINFATPVFSLAIGHIFNAEAISARVAGGTSLILAGLVLHELQFGRAPAADAARARP
jgi:drug/metabolite transporter (DMT)-like permease